jgi:glucose-6-phosphate 1-dehydrogenase
MPLVLGASGDLAKKKTFPALFGLFKNNFLPVVTHIVGYARTHMDMKTFHERISAYIKTPTDADKQLLEKFLKRCTYIVGQYDKDADFQLLMTYLNDLEGNTPEQARHHIFYMALPPSQFTTVATCIKNNCYSSTGVNRLVVEKPHRPLPWQGDGQEPHHFEVCQRVLWCRVEPHLH